MASLTTNILKTSFSNNLHLKIAKQWAQMKQAHPKGAKPQKDPREASERRARARADVDRLLHRAH